MAPRFFDQAQEHVVANSSTYPKPRFLAVVIGLIGILLFWQGVLLLMAGGSYYYALKWTPSLTQLIRFYK